MPGCFCIVPTETALTHARLIGQHRKRKIVREMALDALMQRAEFLLCRLQGQRGAERGSRPRGQWQSRPTKLLDARSDSCERSFEDRSGA